MERLIATVAVLVVIAVALPTVARAAQEAIPMLVGLLVVLALLVAALPGRGGRR
jgi:beta-lactamase regulating signal transducer with metallopeptidase domain